MWDVSPHTFDERLCLHSDSDEASREPEPVFPSATSAVAPGTALLSVVGSERRPLLGVQYVPLGREASRGVEPKPDPTGLVFQMLLPHV